ncbi:MAG: Holliday junction resolvase RecU [Lachnospiraceae bacterium]|nr:Holliday junction resolvase RecU [Lachnospiraceae bacterium]
MSYWNSRGLRGSTFEETINFTNDLYRKKNIALIQKIPTPITPVEIDSEKRVITLGYFEKQSTVDYIGVASGVPICFDAKETANKSLPLQNIHFHQIEFMQDFEKQGGYAFLLVRFSETDEVFILTLKTLKKYWDCSIAGGRKSIPYSAFDKNLIVRTGKGFADYIEALGRLGSKNEE